MENSSDAFLEGVFFSYSIETFEYEIRRKTLLSKKAEMLDLAFYTFGGLKSEDRQNV